ncbi:hypothetical protein D3C80_1555310 [compost metagenome]
MEVLFRGDAEINFESTRSIFVICLSKTMVKIFKIVEMSFSLDVSSNEIAMCFSFIYLKLISLFSAIFRINFASSTATTMVSKNRLVLILKPAFFSSTASEKVRLCISCAIAFIPSEPW